MGLGKKIRVLAKPRSQSRTARSLDWTPKLSLGLRLFPASEACLAVPDAQRFSATVSKPGTLLIINPASGNLRARRRLPDLIEAARAALGPIETAVTAAPGDATRLARKAAEDGRELIVAIGGDGTLNEVLNGIMRSSLKVPVGFIPQGTGSDFRHSLSLADERHAWEAIGSGRTRQVDVGRVIQADGTGRFFLNVLSCGLGGLVDRFATRRSRLLGGRLAYYLAFLRALALGRFGKVRCSVRLRGEGTERTFHALLIAICNGLSFGSGMKIAPMARIDDGVLDVISLSASSKAAFLLGSPSIYSGQHMKRPTVSHFQCDRLRLELINTEVADKFLLDIDGEAAGGLPIEVDVLPGALTFRV